MPITLIQRQFLCAAAARRSLNKIAKAWTVAQGPPADEQRPVLEWLTAQKDAEFAMAVVDFVSGSVSGRMTVDALIAEAQACYDQCAAVDSPATGATRGRKPKTSAFKGSTATP
jgi:hypothetical protein